MTTSQHFYIIRVPVARVHSINPSDSRLDILSSDSDVESAEWLNTLSNGTFIVFH